MTQLLAAIASYFFYLAAKMGFRVAYYTTILTAMTVLYVGGFAVFYLAIKALIVSSQHWFTVPTLAQYMLYFMPSEAATSSVISLVVGSHVIAANMRVFMFGVEGARTAALSGMSGN